MINLTQEKVHYLFKYDNIIGKLYWKNVIPGNNRIVGLEAGHINSSGYKIVSINNRIYYVHRIIWLYIYNKIPKEIDHINQNKIDNRIDNLREITRSKNCRNVHKSSNNTSGVKGVSYDFTHFKYRAQITVKNKNYHIGRYNSFIDAVYARFATEQCLDWHKSESNSSAYQYIKENDNNKIKL